MMVNRSVCLRWLLGCLWGRHPALGACLTVLLLGFSSPVAGVALSLEQDRPVRRSPRRAAEAQQDEEAEEGEIEASGGPQAENATASTELGEHKLGWRLNTRSDNQAELKFRGGDRGKPRVEIIVAPTGVLWHIRLGLAAFPLAGQEPHLIRFRARAGARQVWSAVHPGAEIQRSNVRSWR